mgnify:CR=1 FL=1
MLGKKQLPELAEDTRKTEKIPEEMPGLDGREMPDNEEGLPDPRCRTSS